MATGTEGKPRYYALDSVRATAMLLGVVYHTLTFDMFFSAGGTGMGPMGPMTPSRWIQDWLHSFRMPLFFLISGFFGRMMLEKYGTGEFLKRRWTRIGLPLVVGMFTLSPLYILTRDLVASPMPGFGPPGAGPRGGPGGGIPGPPGDLDDMPPPPPGFMPPPFRQFDENGDGSLSDAEWKKARAELPGMRPPGGGMPGPFGSGGGLAVRVFGPWERFVQLHHLWFLWYLLVFVTVAPFVTRPLRRRRPPADLPDRVGLPIVRFGLAPLVLGLVSIPALLLCSNPFGGVGLGLAPAIFRAFPDFVLHPDPDMLFYFLYFLTGWWLHRERDGLSSVARAWLPCLALGLIAFVLANRLGDPGGPFVSRGAVSGRLGPTALYCCGSAFTAFGFLGVFQRYLDRPSRGWRYLADTALWVYLIHQPLVLAYRALVGPLHLTWWARAAAVSSLSVASALILYELVVRPTPLVRVFGPSGAGGRRDRPGEEL